MLHITWKLHSLAEANNRKAWLIVILNFKLYMAQTLKNNVKRGKCINQKAHKGNYGSETTEFNIW